MGMGVVSALGLALIFGWIGFIWWKKKQQAWAATKGKVISLTIVRHHDPVGNWTTHPRVTYEYAVNGKTFRSTRIRIGEVPETSLTIARYPIGIEVDVFYDPARPNDAVLEREKATRAS